VAGARPAGTFGRLVAGCCRSCVGRTIGLGLPARLVDATGVVFTVAGWPEDAQS